MKMFKTAILSTLTCLATSAFAGAQTSITPAPATKIDHFDEFKQRALTRTDKEISILQQSKTCLSAAHNKAAAQVCYKNKMGAMQKLHGEDKEHMEKMKKAHPEMMDKKLAPTMP